MKIKEIVYKAKEDDITMDDGDGPRHRGVRPRIRSKIEFTPHDLEFINLNTPLKHVTFRRLLGEWGVMLKKDGCAGVSGTAAQQGHRRDVRSATFAPRHNNASQIIMDV